MWLSYRFNPHVQARNSCRTPFFNSFDWILIIRKIKKFKCYGVSRQIYLFEHHRRAIICHHNLPSSKPINALIVVVELSYRMPVVRLTHSLCTTSTNAFLSHWHHILNIHIIRNPLICYWIWYKHTDTNKRMLPGLLALDLAAANAFCTVCIV